MLYQIYLITNLINNKKYVGQTKVDIGYKKRFLQHIVCINSKKHSKLLHKAMKKYGVENFTVELVEDNINEQLIDAREIYWIEFFNTYCKNSEGYNLTLGGQGTHGYIRTEADLLKQSQGSKKYWLELKEYNPAEYKRLCQLRSVNLKGKPKSATTREKLSLAAKNRFKKSPGTFTGKKHSEYSKDLVSKANGARVAMCDAITGDIIQEFQSAVKATEYLIKIGKTKNRYANTRIFEVCNGNAELAYGYKWKRLN